MKQREDRDSLRQAGCTEREIFWLTRLRQRYAKEQEKLEEGATFRRLQFVRWLVTTGKLTEQIAEAV